MGGTFQRIENVLTYSAMFSTMAMMLLTTVDAGGRYIFNTPILWAYEFTEDYLLVATVFLGTTIAYREGGFIRVTFFTEKLSKRAQQALVVLAQVVCIGLCLLFLVSIFYQARKAPFTVTLDVLPSGPGYLIVLLGLSAATLVMILDLFAGKSGFVKEEPKDF